MTNKEKIASYKKKYREDNKEKIVSYIKKYNEDNKEKMTAKRKKYYTENKEKILSRNKRYREDNKEKLAEQSKKYTAAHVEENRARAAAWYKENPERGKANAAAWYAENPERGKANAKVATHKRRARIAKVGGKFTKEDIKNLYTTQGGSCYYCSVDIEHGYEIEHMTPISRGGSNWIDNVCLACAPCNHTKHTQTVEEFMNG